MTDSCLRSVKCKECGIRGHTKKDCPQTGTRGHTKIDCPQTGTRGQHDKINCPVSVQACHETREKVRSIAGGEIIKPFRFDPMDKEEFLKRKGKRKRKKSEDIEISTGSEERDQSVVLSVSFTLDVPEMKDVIKVKNVRPVKRRRILDRGVAGHDRSPVGDIIILDDSPVEVSEDHTNSAFKVIDVFSGDGESDFHVSDAVDFSITILSSDEEIEEVGGREKNNNAFDELGNTKSVKDESEEAFRNVNGEKGTEKRMIESVAEQAIEKEKLEAVTSQAQNLSQNIKGEYFEQNPVTLDLKEEVSNQVPEVKLDLKTEEIVDSEKPREKKSSRLEVGNYSVVSIHVEVFRSSKSSTTKLTQIGCTLWGQELQGFFRAVKPRGLEKYLDTCKLGGDLLRALHMTREDDGTFQFRSQFEIIEHEKKINCVEERKALKDLLQYLRKIPNCLLLGVDEDTIAILDQRLRDEKKEKLKNIVSGFTCWKLVLKYLKIDGYRKIDLEEFYSDMVKAPLPSFVSAKDISEVLLKAVRHVMTRLAKEGSDQLQMFYTLCRKIEFLSKPRRVEYDRKAPVENLEVYSSLRPFVSATISAQQMEQVAISSESEDDCVMTGEIKKSTDPVVASEKSGFPANSEQSLQINPGLTLQEIWRKQSNKDDDDELLRKIQDKFKEIDNRQQQLKETYGEKLDAALNVNEDLYADDNDDSMVDDGLTNQANSSFPSVEIHLSRPLPLYVQSNTTTRIYNPTNSNFWQRGNKSQGSDSRGSVFCPVCCVEVKYRKICRHLQRVHSETSYSLRCQACYEAVSARDLEVHVDRKCFVDKVNTVSDSVAPGPQTAARPSDGYLDTVCLPGIWVMSDPCPQSRITEPWTREQLSKALSDEQVLRTYLESYLRHNYGPKHGAKLPCEWVYRDYQQHTQAGGGNHVLSPKKFLVVVSELMLRDIGVSVGPFIYSMGPYQKVTSLRHLYLQGLIYKVKL